MTSTRQDGSIVLPIALVILTIMTVSVAALLRMVDGAGGAAGNIAFKEWAVQAGTRGVSAAVRQFDPVTNGVLSLADNQLVDQPLANYIASTLPSDARGVPNVMLDPVAFDTQFTNAAMRVNLGAGEVARFLIERLCTRPGPADDTNCVTVTNSERSGSQPYNKTGSESLPMYRITVRVDGPRNTVHYTQIVYRPS